MQADSLEDLETIVPAADKRGERELCCLAGTIPDDVLDLPAVARLRGSHFADTDVGVVFDAIRTMHDSGRGINAHLLSAELQRSGQLERIGGYAMLIELFEEAPPLPHLAPYYAERIFETWCRRQLRVLAIEHLQLASDETKDLPTLLASAESKLHGVIEATVSGAGEPSLTDQIVGFLAALEHGKRAGQPTGYAGLDRLITGFGPGQLLTLAARPSMGKSSLAADFARHAVKHGGVLYASLEMKHGELLERIISAESRVPASRIRNRRLSDDERGAVVDAATRVAGWPLCIADAPVQRVSDIAARARLLKRKQNLGLVIIDYLQLVEPDDRRANREVQVSTITRQVKQMAMGLDLPVIALAQLNRGLENLQ